MGEWSHPAHCTETARAYVKRERAAQIAVFMELAMPRMREAARRCGYALAVHGTLIRDLDVIACPWAKDARSADELVAALGVVIAEVTGWGHQQARDWTEKPHGRVAAILIAGPGGDVHMDLSVMPRLAELPKAEPDKPA